ncbi:MAG: hypothetical protein Ct9H300mP14_04540 [Gammaproteobacteria bacterium]|nr:MAG: hypothetical protein Ct9H300mP14_04540 [Gammaproteobacteria bacterium]
METQIGLFGILGGQGQYNDSEDFRIRSDFDIVRFEFIGRKVLKAFSGVRKTRALANLQVNKNFAEARIGEFPTIAPLSL